MNSSTPGSWRKWLTVHSLVVGTLLVVGVAFRIYGAWASRYIADPDSGVVALMVKHIAGGAPWPVFFYGQAYMGTLEPLLSAALARVCGVNGFVVNLGTAVAGICSLPVIYLLGRGAGGRAGGLAGLALCLMGPSAYLMFQFIPRGGYAMVLLLLCILMYLTCCTAAKLWSGERVGGGVFFAIGVVGGMGWWTSQLIAPALLTSAIVLAVAMRGRLLSTKVLLGAAGFALGSLPFWLWNAGHEWQSFGMNEGLRLRELGAAPALIWPKYVKLHGLQQGPPWLAHVVHALYLAVPAGGLVVGCVVAFRRRVLSGRLWYAAYACLFAVLLLAVYCSSSFAKMNTARYLTPLAPAFAVMTAYAVGLCGGRKALLVAVAVPVVLIAACQAPVLGYLRKRSLTVEGRQDRDHRLAEMLREAGENCAYATFHHYALNFNLGEEFSFTDLRGERYLPMGRAVELSSRVAVVGDTGRLTHFLGAAGGKADFHTLPGYYLHCNMKPPAGALSEIDPGQWAGVRDGRGNDARAALTDRDLCTTWQGRVNAETGECVQVEFSQPQAVRAVRMTVLDPRSYPRAIEVSGRDAEGEWHVLRKELRVTDYYWSGPRVYWGGRRRRLEYRFDDCPLTALRFASLSKPRDATTAWTLSELQCFAPAEGAADPVAALPGLLELIRSRSIRRVYADRWVANRLHEMPGPEVEVELEPKFFPESIDRMTGAVRWGPDMAFVVETHDAPVTRGVLALHGVRMRETACGPWVVLDFAEGPPTGSPPIHWTGYNCLTGRKRAVAFDAVAEASRAMARGDAQAARRLLEKAVELYPNAISVAGDLVVELAEAAPEGGGSELQRLHRECGAPKVSARGAFADGIVFEGITLGPSEVSPGGALTLRYFWRCPNLEERGRWVAFVHFRGDDGVFQDDHHLLARHIDSDVFAGAGRDELHQECRSLVVPGDTPPGRYAMWIGLYNVHNAARARVRTELPTRRRAMRVPVEVLVR